MDELTILLLVLPVVGLLTWRFLIGSAKAHRHERNAASSMNSVHGRSSAEHSLPRARYTAKSLRICNSPCKAALKFRDHSFLLAEAPALPLEGCDRTCFCEYSLHNDRRLKADRRYPSEDIVAVDSLLLPDSAVEIEDARVEKDRRKKRAKEKRPYAGIS